MPVTPAKRQAIVRRAGGLGEYCHADERWQFVRFTVDHILPRSADGGDDLGNLALACRNCNERRSNLIVAEDPQTGAIVAVYHPRLDSWNDHFSWEAHALRIVGTTATGRATVRLLDLNDERHDRRCLRIRERDREDGFHPPVTDRRLS